MLQINILCILWKTCASSLIKMVWTCLPRIWLCGLWQPSGGSESCCCPEDDRCPSSDGKGEDSLQSNPDITYIQWIPDHHRFSASAKSTWDCLERLNWILKQLPQWISGNRTPDTCILFTRLVEGVVMCQQAARMSPSMLPIRPWLASCRRKVGRQCHCVFWDFFEYARW